MDDITMNTTYPDSTVNNVDYNTTFPDNTVNNVDYNTTFPENDYIDIGDDNINLNSGSGLNYTDDPINVMYSGTGTNDLANIIYSGTGMNYMDFDSIISSYTGTEDTGNQVTNYEISGIPSYNQVPYYKKNDECDYRGKWGSKDEANIIKQCNKCVSNNGFYGEKQYFCDGRCISRYRQSVCPSTGLVATNIEQCKNPCYKSPPVLNGFCKDDFDCDIKDQCYKDEKFYKGIKGVCLRRENYKFIGIM
jgi:hypothetical protein